MVNNFKTVQKIFTISILCSLLLPSHSFARNQSNNNNKCNYSLSELSQLLVKDISDYGNRVIQKSKRKGENYQSLPVYIITANQPELEELPLIQTQYRHPQKSEVKQIFFTTLERQYLSNNHLQQTENYHWLLLTPTSHGWQMVMLLTRLGVEDKENPAYPPINSTSGVMGEAVRIWLRDCNSGVKY